MGPDARVISFSGETETGSRLFSKLLDIKPTRYIEPLEGIIYYRLLFIWEELLGWERAGRGLGLDKT